MQELRHCAICGNAFIAKTGNGRYCGKQCREEGNRILVRERCATYRAEAKGKAIERAGMKSQKGNGLSLEQAAAEARKVGMTYGQYVAQMNRKK